MNIKAYYIVTSDADENSGLDSTMVVLLSTLFPVITVMLILVIGIISMVAHNYTRIHKNLKVN